jgi:hypothetical protein
VFKSNAALGIEKEQIAKRQAWQSYIEANFGVQSVSVATSRPPLLWAAPGHRRDRRLLRDLPDVAAGIADAGGAHAPWPIHWAVQQLHSAGGQLRAHGIHVIHLDSELEAGSDLATPLLKAR